MLALLAATAFASDMHPGLVLPSAVRTDDVAAVQVSGGVGHYVFFLSDGRGAAGTLQAGVDVTDRLRLGAYGGLGSTEACFSGLFGGGSCDRTLDRDLVLSASYAVIDEPRFRLAPFVAGGTYLQAGVSLWWQSPRKGVELDFAWGPALETDPLLDPYFGPTLEVEPVTAVPEFGLTVYLDGRRQHSTRFGFVSAMPQATYRFDPGPVAFELTAGTVGLVSMARAGISLEF